MIRLGGLWIATLAVAAVLTGCSVSPAQDAPNPAIQKLMRDTGLADSPPGFLSVSQEAEDILPDEASGIGGDPATSRFQGTWNGQAVYLTVKGENMVYLVSGPQGEEQIWAGGGSLGNTAFSMEDTSNGETLVYLPQGTATVPTGWVALSDWVIVKVVEPH